MSNAEQTFDHQVTELSSGTAAHVWKPQQSPYRAAIVLQHGYAEYAERYLSSHNSIITHFLKKGYAVYAMDLWGHGSSPGTRGVVHLGRAVLDHIELRKRVNGLGLPVILFGHSLGGLVTAGSMVSDKTIVNGVVLTGPAFPSAIPYIARLALGAATAAMPKVSVPRKAIPLEGLTRNADEIEKYWKDDGFHKDPVSFLLAATALDTMQNISTGLKEWTVPTIVIHGNADPYCDWKASERFVKDIASEDKGFHIYKDGRHEVLHDLDGGTVLAQILDWIESHI